MQSMNEPVWWKAALSTSFRVAHSSNEWNMLWWVWNHWVVVPAFPFQSWLAHLTLSLLGLCIAESWCTWFKVYLTLSLPLQMKGCWVWVAMAEVAPGRQGWLQARWVGGTLINHNSWTWKSRTLMFGSWLNGACYRVFLMNEPKDEKPLSLHRI